MSPVYKKAIQNPRSLPPTAPSRDHDQKGESTQGSEMHPIFHGMNSGNMIIILHDQITAYNCRSISRTATVQAIEYEISPTKIAGTKLIDESGLRESNPKP
jgi:hypothetical protein